jgi:Na+/proline symporter
MGTAGKCSTFLSAPGQAFTDGMRFVQYYLAFPLAMVFYVSLCAIISKLKVFTAYEFLEKRFDVRPRYVLLVFFAAKSVVYRISIYAPSIILSSLLGWDIFLNKYRNGWFAHHLYC